MLFGGIMVRSSKDDQAPAFVRIPKPKKTRNKHFCSFITFSDYNTLLGKNQSKNAFLSINLLISGKLYNNNNLQVIPFVGILFRKQIK